SVGEAMAIGRTFCESLQKAIRSMEVKRFGLGLDKNDKWLAAMRALGAQQSAANPWDTAGELPVPVADAPEGTVEGAPVMPELRTADGELLEWPIPDDKLIRKLVTPSQGRLYYIRYALKLGYTQERIAELTKIDPFFIDQIARIVSFEDVLMEF